MLSFEGGEERVATDKHAINDPVLCINLILSFFNWLLIGLFLREYKVPTQKYDHTKAIKSTYLLRKMTAIACISTRPAPNVLKTRASLGRRPHILLSLAAHSQKPNLPRAFRVGVIHSICAFQFYYRLVAFSIRLRFNRFSSVSLASDEKKIYKNKMACGFRKAGL